MFFAPAQAAGLWGTDLNRVLPNTYGVQSTYVLVLSTQSYVDNYWTKAEFDAVAARAPGRILLLDMGAIPADLPCGLVYRGKSSAEMAILVEALRKKLTSCRSGDPHRRQVQTLEPGTRRSAAAGQQDRESQSVARERSRLRQPH